MEKFREMGGGEKKTEISHVEKIEGSENEAGYPTYTVVRKEVEEEAPVMPEDHLRANETEPTEIEITDYQNSNASEEAALVKLEKGLSTTQRMALVGAIMAAGVAVSKHSEEAYDAYTETDNVSSAVEQDVINDLDSAFNNEIASYEQQLPLVDVIETINTANNPEDIRHVASRLQTFLDNVDFPSVQYKGKSVELPEELQSELKKIIPGWIAVESRFKTDAKNEGSGATGLAQFKIKTWNDYFPDDKEVSLDAAKQAKAFSGLTADNYKYVIHYAGEESLNTIRNQFDSDEDFYRDFMVQFLSTAHNSGGPAAGRALKLFCEQVAVEDFSSGKDLFLQFSEFALQHADNYGDEQRRYAPRVIAYQNMIDKYTVEQQNRVAMNK